MRDSIVDLDAAVLLAHALVAQIAASSEIPCLFIKGPGCRLQGLRPGGTISSDVDAWAEPAHAPRLIELLETRGWARRPRSELDDFYPVHSVTLYHPSWPCDIDVHSRFPGMDGEPGSVFAHLWSRRTYVELAHWPVPLPSLPDHALILALHALRTPWSAKGQKELQFLIHSCLPELDFDGLAAIALATGGAGAAAPFLDALPGASHPPPSWPDPSDEWLVRTIARSPGSLRLIDIVKSPWRQRPRLILRALFPKPETYTARNLHLDLTDRLTSRRVRLRRLFSGLASVPSALAETARYVRARRSLR
ncbi:hypothetical protein GCM10009851_26320 [Herbiconiux moechotypicola]|uniref:Nucleotidyltransferase family protein n=1 Tax=Herbiconiux moechotypicola TaxID=637393 RepID=A0ABP5QPZ2_9MICO